VWLCKASHNPFSGEDLSELNDWLLNAWYCGEEKTATKSLNFNPTIVVCKTRDQGQVHCPLKVKKALVGPVLPMPFQEAAAAVVVAIPFLAE
jgi:hypothetical protein